MIETMHYFRQIPRLAATGTCEIDAATVLWRHEKPWPIVALNYTVKIVGGPAQIDVWADGTTVSSLIGDNDLSSYSSSLQLDVTRPTADVQLRATPLLDEEDPVVALARESLGQTRPRPKVAVEWSISVVGQRQ